MRNYRIVFFLILMFFTQGLNAQEVKRPTEVFGLYFETFVRYDVLALAKLNNYLKPVMEGKDAYQIDLKQVSGQMAKTSAENFLSIFPAAVAADCKKEGEDFFAALSENFRKGKLSIKKVELVQNEYVPDQKIAKIIYSVSFLVPSTLSEVIVPDSEKVKADELKRFLTGAIVKFKNADKIVRTEQEFSLYSLKQDGKVYYWNGGPDEIVSKLTDFYFGSFGVK